MAGVSYEFYSLRTPAANFHRQESLAQTKAILRGTPSPTFFLNDCPCLCQEEIISANLQVPMLRFFYRWSEGRLMENG